MSSAIFVAELQTDAGLRRLLSCSNLIALAVGAGILLNLPVPVGLRTLAAAGWGFVMVLEYFGRRARQQQLRRIRVYADGSAQLLDRTGTWTQATVCRDSVVLARFAWLRLNFADGRRHAELLTGNSRESQDWRRLQVIWKHLSRPAASRLGSSS